MLATRERMLSRGPDGVGAWWSDGPACGLGHRRLAIIDLSDRGAQPMTDADGALVIVFNGEIYNYRELRARARGARRALPHRFRHRGAAAPLRATTARRWSQRLRGMFAFAIWDARTARLFLARDPYGIKPLYYADDGRTFRFASQVKALLAGGAVSRDPEPAGIAGFHLFGSVPEPFTL